MEEKQHKHHHQLNQLKQYSHSGALKALLPEIKFKAEKDKTEFFPTRNNFHYKRKFSKFITNKINSKENFTPNIVHLNLNYANKMQLTQRSSRLIASDLNLFHQDDVKKENFSETSYDVDDFEEKKLHTHTINLTPFLEPIEKPKQFKKNSKKSKKLKQYKSVQFKENKSDLKEDTQQQSDLEEDELKKIHYHTPIIKGKQKHVIDLNFVSSNSRLSEHYLRPYSINLEQNECSLSDMNLNEIWPHSNMVKQSTKNNSWINTFKARSIANEINRTYCDTTDLSRSDYVPSFLPNLKTPDASLTNSRLENNSKTSKKYSIFLPDIKISYCQKQIL